MTLYRKFICAACGHEWELPQAIGGNHDFCPACGRKKVHRIDAGIRREEFRSSDRQSVTAGPAQI